MDEVRGSAGSMALYWRVGVTAFAFAVGLSVAIYGLYSRSFPDFVVFWTAARHATDPLLYDQAHLTALQTWQPGSGPRPFVYPPTFLLLAWPFGLLPYPPAYLLWVGLSCAAFVFAASWLVRPGWAAAILPLCLPVMIAAAYGQSVLFAGAAFVGALVLLERRPATAGALLAFAACTKPQLMVLSPILLVGHWRALGGAVAAGVALVLASLVFGWRHWLEWPPALQRFALTVHQLPLKFVNPLSPGFSTPEKLLVMASGIGFAIWCSRRSLPERLVGVVGGSLCCTLYAVKPDLGILAPSALAWVLEGRSLATWLRRIAGAAFLCGLITVPAGVVAFMAATVVAGLPGLDRPWPPNPGRGRAGVS